jgi:hypothetical protein
MHKDENAATVDKFSQVPSQKSHMQLWSYMWLSWLGLLLLGHAVFVAEFNFEICIYGNRLTCGSTSTN